MAITRMNEIVIYFSNVLKEERLSEDALTDYGTTQSRAFVTGLGMLTVVQRLQRF